MYPVHILRHGETTWNLERRVQGRLDAPLTDRGRAQAADQGRIVAEISAAYPDLTVHCSPQGRARATWEIAARCCGHEGPVRFDERLSEVDMGVWQGLTHEEIAPRWPGIYTAHDTVFALSLNTPGGERYASLAARVSGFLGDLSGPALVVTHGITSSVLRGQLLGLEFDEMAWLDHEQGVVFAIENGLETVLRPIP